MVKKESIIKVLTVLLYCSKELHFVTSSCGKEIVAAAAKDEANSLSSRGILCLTPFLF